MEAEHKKDQADVFLLLGARRRLVKCLEIKLVHFFSPHLERLKKKTMVIFVLSHLKKHCCFTFFHMAPRHINTFHSILLSSTFSLGTGRRRKPQMVHLDKVSLKASQTQVSGWCFS